MIILWNLNTANHVAKKFHVKHLISFNGHITTSISAEMLKLLDSENELWSLLYIPTHSSIASLIYNHLKPDIISYDLFHVKHLILFDITGSQKKSCRTGAGTTCNCLILSNSNNCFTWNVYAGVSNCHRHVLGHERVALILVSRLLRQQVLPRMIRYTELRRKYSRNLFRLVSIKEVCFYEW